MTVLAKRVSQISIEPACSARLAAARLRRACGGPILAAPPVRAIQASIPLESENRRRELLWTMKEIQCIRKGINGWF